MTREDLKPFLKALLRAADYFGAELSATAQTVYFEALADLDLATVQAAIAASTRACRFMPKAVEIRDLAEGSADDRAQRAWAQLQQAAKSCGAYTSIRVEDPATVLALERTFGTWVAFCTVELEPPMVAAKRKEFLANYRIAQRQPVEQPRLCLPGLAEAHNRDTATVWGPSRPPVAQTRGVLLADGGIDREPMVLDPDSGRLLAAHDGPQLAGEVESPPALVDVSQALREAAAARQMTAPAEPVRGVCPSCGATAKDREHAPECETVTVATAHEALIRRQALELAGEACSA